MVVVVVWQLRPFFPRRLCDCHGLLEQVRGGGGWTKVMGFSLRALLYHRILGQGYVGLPCACPTLRQSTGRHRR